MMGPCDASSLEASLRPPDRRGQVSVSGGRRLGVAAWGAEDAPIVVFLHGAGMSGRLGFGVDRLSAHGVQLIAVDRPGVGQSDHDPGKTLTTVAADIDAALSTLDRPVLGAVGFSMGAPFALALLAAGIVPSLALVAPQDDLAHPDVRPHVSEDVGNLVDAVAEDPDRFEDTFAAMIDAAEMRALILETSSPEDRSVYEHPVFATALSEALDDGFRNGSAGYARDLRVALSPWPMDFGAMDRPVTIWCGAYDTSPVHSPDCGETLAARCPNGRVRLVVDGGSALLWTHSDDILADLLAQR
ncbi:MAG: alpha/beta hydrolase [Pseudomonadota bacterium]